MVSEPTVLKTGGTFGLALEVAGQFTAVIVGLLIIGMIMLGVLARIETMSATEARLRTLIEQAGDRIEASLSLGIGLEDTSETQAAVERLAATEPKFTTLDIFDANGVFVASTDRASILRPAPAEWVATARANNKSLALPQGARLIIVPLEGAFGDVAGYLVASFSQPTPLAPDWRRFAVVVGVVVGILGALIYAEVANFRQPVEATLVAMAGGEVSSKVPQSARDAIDHLAKSDERVSQAMRDLGRT
jgi:hypothetical protein